MQYLVSRGLLKNVIVMQQCKIELLPVNFMKSCLNLGVPISLLFFFLLPRGEWNKALALLPIFITPIILIPWPKFNKNKLSSYDTPVLWSISRRPSSEFDKVMTLSILTIVILRLSAPSLSSHWIFISRGISQMRLRLFWVLVLSYRSEPLVEGWSMKQMRSDLSHIARTRNTILVLGLQINAKD